MISAQDSLRSFDKDEEQIVFAGTKRNDNIIIATNTATKITSSMTTIKAP